MTPEEEADQRNHESLVHALEDLPEEDRHKLLLQLKDIGNVPAADRKSHARHIWDVMEDAGGAVFGEAECLNVLGFIRDRPVTNYTYEVDGGVLSRGARPNPQKFQNLHSEGFKATINLCEEMPNGDGDLIDRVGLTEGLSTVHIPMVDGEYPKIGQVFEFLNLLNDTGVDTPAYVHCEQGVGRTGVMTACYRMAAMGWGVDDALTEAKNFGCGMPMQHAFIEEFGRLLASAAHAPYPLVPFGTVRATEEQLAAKVSDCLDPPNPP